MEQIAKIVKSPFKLFSAFSEDDKDIFFGRSEEVKSLYQLMQEAHVALLYGEGGTGKSSLIQCGLLNEVQIFNWTSVVVRRFENINESFEKALLNKLRDENGNPSAGHSPRELLKDIFVNSFQPILLLFDQFEELYILGTEYERQIFYNNIEQILGSKISVKFVFVLKEEYLAKLSEFEKRIPGIFKKRLRIELAKRANAREIIVDSCKRFNIGIFPLRQPGSTESDLPEKIIDIVSDEKRENQVHLPYLQVFLDTLWIEAFKKDPDNITFDESIVEKVGNIGNVLKAFVETKINEQSILSKVDAWKLLKLFAPETGNTRNKVTLSEYTSIPADILSAAIDYFKTNSLVMECSPGTYELAHETLIPVIQQKNIKELRPRILEPTISGNPYIGLRSFDENDADRFYGRKDVVKAVYERVLTTDFVVIAGNSGSGKSSLIKAGLFPLLKKDGYIPLPIIKAGDRPLVSIENALTRIRQYKGDKYILLIDQYEELVTRVVDGGVRTAVYQKIYALLQNNNSYTLKVIITIRADFEPQFRIAEPLSSYWTIGKYLVPPFTKDEIREIIEEPAYQAGLEFAPPSLVDTITDEVYSSQATGLLPLMSFTLSELYKRYAERNQQDKLLTESDYKSIGGVIGGIQKRAEDIYTGFQKKYPSDYLDYQKMMRNIMLRMIYFSAGEIAGQRVLQDDLIFSKKSINQIAENVVDELLKSHLIVGGSDSDGKLFIEPAHDVLVKTWGQIWDWIGTFGKNALELQGRLLQPVNDYYTNGENEKFLWNENPWLDETLHILNSEDNWFNAREAKFISKSLKKREQNIEIEEKKQQEKIELTEAKIREEQEKSILIREKLDEQKSKTSRGRIFLAVLSVAFSLAAYFAISTEQQSTLAKANLKKADSATAKYLRQLDSTSQAKKYAEIKAYAALDSAAIARQERNIALHFKLLADSAAKTLRIANNNLINEKEIANQAKNAADSANKVAQNKSEEYFRQKVKAEELAERLRKQTGISISRIISLAKAYATTDKVKSYQLASLAYQRDSLNSEVKNYFNDLRNEYAYFYIKDFEGNFSSYSPDGKLIIVASEGKIKILDKSNYSHISDMEIKPNFLSAIFTNENNILITYEDGFELRDKKGGTMLSEKQKNVSYTCISPNSNILMVVADEKMILYDLNSGRIMGKLNDAATKKTNLAVFSNDGKHIIFNSSDGGIKLLDLATFKIDDRKDLNANENSYISPFGNFFIAKSGKSFHLFNSLGKEERNLSKLSSNNDLVQAVFSKDGQKLILVFDHVSYQKQQQQQQVQQRINRRRETHQKEFFLVDLLNLNVTQLDANNYYDLGYASNIVFDKNVLLLPGRSDGTIDIITVPDGSRNKMFGHTGIVTSMAVDNTASLILTSSRDQKTKIWKRDMPRNLAQAKLLPELSPLELKELGIDD